MGNGKRLTLGVMLLLAIAPAMFPQSDAIAVLRTRLLRAGTNCIVKIDGLHARTDLLNRPVEMHIVNGVISRAATDILHGKVDVALPAGLHVRVIRVEALTGNKSDALRLLLAAGNIAVPVSFAVEKGTLTRMTEGELAALIDPILFVPPPPAEPMRPVTRKVPAQPNPVPAAPEERPLQPLIPSEALQSIQSLLRKNRQVTLRLDGLHGAMSSPGFTRDNRMINGAFEPRPASETQRGMRDVRVPPGQSAEFIDLTPLASDENDILRLVLRAPAGAYIPIAFVLPKNGLGGLSEEQIYRTMSAAVVMPSLLPPHPANTVLDLKPAAPGFAPMHASENAIEGCWYAPYLSKRWDLEAAVLDCEKETDGWKTKASDTLNGVALQVSNSEPEEIFTVHTKPADQTIEAAIRQQFITKLKSPAARAGCRAQCKIEFDGLVNCDVVAFGAYAKQKRFQSHGEKGDAEEPCPDLAGGEVMSTFFVYRPAESKTKFLFFNASDTLSGLNIATVHFLPEL